MKPDLNLLLVFDAVARTGSVSAAARHLALSQPAISHALARLRTATGDALFTRAGRGLVPTPRAHAMMAPVRDMLAQADAVFAAPAFDPAQSRDRFVIGASDYAAFTLMPQVMQRLATSAPQVQIALMPVAAQVPEQLTAGRLDLSFWGTEAPGNGLLYQRLFRETYVGVARAGHPVFAGNGGKVTLPDYLRYGHAVVALQAPGPHAIDHALATAGLRRRVMFASHSFAGNLALLAGSDLIASMPQRLCAGLDPRLRRFALPLDVPGYDYGMVWHARTQGLHSHVWLRSVIAAAVDDLGAADPAAQPRFMTNDDAGAATC